MRSTEGAVGAAIIQMGAGSRKGIRPADVPDPGSACAARSKAALMAAARQPASGARDSCLRLTVGRAA
jgi:hypothetical protein